MPNRIIRGDSLDDTKRPIIICYGISPHGGGSLKKPTLMNVVSVIRRLPSGNHKVLKYPFTNSIRYDTIEEFNVDSKAEYTA